MLVTTRASFPTVPRILNGISLGSRFVIAVGKISLKDEHGTSTKYDYCDVWQLKGGKLHELKAYVISIDR
ncbi:hypothetical protein [Pedobacter heparinus]|uniref:hypothetical protein n=1 Tax=Pedobacter heparinus TaxID=984 RepID=UPI00293060E9|nr:hypothetical protein [Pedobacter heparinus]